MPNPHSVTINPETELGICISAIIQGKPFGSATYFMKMFMEQHKQEMIDYWNKKGLNGEELFNKWYKKWSMTVVEQQLANKREEQERIEGKKRMYMKLGYSDVEAEEFAKMPKEDVQEILAVSQAVKAKAYANQTMIATENHEEKQAEKEAIEQRQEADIQRQEQVKAFIAKWQELFEVDDMQTFYRLDKKNVLSREEQKNFETELSALNGKDGNKFGSYVLPKSVG